LKREENTNFQENNNKYYNYVNKNGAFIGA